MSRQKKLVEVLRAHGIHERLVSLIMIENTVVIWLSLTLEMW